MLAGQDGNETASGGTPGESAGESGVDRQGDANALKSTFPTVIIPTYWRGGVMAWFLETGRQVP
jgi:hypothetical protein